MLATPRTTVIGILLVAGLFSVLFLSSTTRRLEHAFTATSSPAISASHSSLEPNQMSTLSVASRIYVISLPRSTNRRLDMEQIRYTLGLDFTYVNGTEADGDAVHRITKHVAALRALASFQGTNHSLLPEFKWPQDIDALVESESPLGREGSDLWLSDDIDFPDLPSHEPLTCARGNFNLDPYSPQLPPFRVLTKERLACWHSHWRVVRSIADGQDDAALILEDDVDMELDIRQRLLGVWDSLPSTWDIVFLGTWS